MPLINSLRVRVGVPSDNSTLDANITLAKDAAFALMGNYCDRFFPKVVGSVEKFTHFTGMDLSLKRYPIESVASIVDAEGKTFTDYHIQSETGTIKLDSAWAFHQVTVTFTGGYSEDALPSDLLVAFYSVFDQEYAAIAGTGSSASGQISSVTLADVGTIRYNTDSAEGAFGEGSFLPSKAKSILEGYKRYKC